MEIKVLKYGSMLKEIYIRRYIYIYFYSAMLMRKLNLPITQFSVFMQFSVLMIISIMEQYFYFVCYLNS